MLTSKHTKHMCSRQHACLCSVDSIAHGAMSLPDLWHAACRMAAMTHCKCRRLDGHGAIVTGGGCSQIGRAIAHRLAQVCPSSGTLPAHHCQGTVWSRPVQSCIMWSGHGSVQEGDLLCCVQLSCASRQRRGQLVSRLCLSIIWTGNALLCCAWSSQFTP